MTYFMLMTENMKKNKRKYYDLMMKKAKTSGASYETFVRIFDTYHKGSSYGDDTGIFIHDDSSSVCYGCYSAHVGGTYYVEVKLIMATKVGGKLL